MLAYAPTFTDDGNKSTGWRTMAVYDTPAVWNSTFRAVAGASFVSKTTSTPTPTRSRAKSCAAASRVRRPPSPTTSSTRSITWPTQRRQALRLNVVPSVTGRYSSGASQTRFDQTLGSGNFTTIGSFFPRPPPHQRRHQPRCFRQNRACAITVAATGGPSSSDLPEPPHPPTPPATVIPEPSTAPTPRTKPTAVSATRCRGSRSASATSRSSLFCDSVMSSELTSQPRLPRTGEDGEFSLRFHPAWRRLEVNVTRFFTTSANNALALSARRRPSSTTSLPVGQRLLGTGDYRDQKTKGWEIEVAAQPQPPVDAARDLLRQLERIRPLLPARAATSPRRAAARRRARTPTTRPAIAQQLLDDTEGAPCAPRVARPPTSPLQLHRRPAQGFAVGTSALRRAKYCRHFHRAAWWCYPRRRPAATSREPVRRATGGKIQPQRHCAVQRVNNVLGLNSDQGNSYTWPPRAAAIHHDRDGGARV